LRFLNKKLEQHNLPLIKNALIDTVQVSRAVNTNLNYHTLGIIARHYKIDYDESIAHRADFDANILYSI
jgi:DNA polymerase-3 subunit alpha (Gram-positive type)